MECELTSPTVREQLMSGTLAHLSSGTASDTSVRALAAASGRSTMCVYSKFGSRSALLTAVFDDAAEQCLAALEPSGDQESMMDLYAQWAADHPGLYQMLFEHDLASLGVETSHRTTLIEQVLAQFSLHTKCGSPADAQRLWSTTHGAIVLARHTENLTTRQ